MRYLIAMQSSWRVQKVRPISLPISRVCLSSRQLKGYNNLTQIGRWRKVTNELSQRDSEFPTFGSQK